MNFRALIIDSDAIMRGFLWQATLASIYFDSVKGASKPANALNVLNFSQPYDAVLIASSFGREPISEFIAAAKKTAAGKEAAYIVVLKAVDQSSTNIASGLVSGIDGFLLEPFSAESLRNAAMVAAQVKSEFEKKRSEAAIRVIVAEVMGAFRQYTNALALEEDVLLARRNLQQSMAALTKIPEEHRNLYYDIASDMFMAVQPRPSMKYKGASNRLKQKQQKKKQNRANA